MGAYTSRLTDENAPCRFSVQPPPEKTKPLQPPLFKSQTRRSIKYFNPCTDNRVRVNARWWQKKQCYCLLGTRSWTRTRSRTGSRAPVVIIFIVVTIATAAIIVSVVFFVVSPFWFASWLFFDWRSRSSFLAWALAAWTATVATPLTAFAATARPVIDEIKE